MTSAKMATKLLVVFEIVVLLHLSACRAWGTLDDAEQLFIEHRQEFEAIHELMDQNPALLDVSPGYDLDRDLRFIPKYNKFTEITKSVYMDIVSRMQSLGLQRVVNNRFRGLQGGPMQVMEFIVFARGLGGNTEGIFIAFVNGDEPIENSQSDETVCRAIADSKWYVCHSK
jgi:hypothetical protein